MKLCVACPATGQNKIFDFEDDRKLRAFMEKRMSQQVEADSLGEEWKGYVFEITGGNDKQGFPMMQGVMTNGRVRLLLKKGQTCYRPRRKGERRRKSVRGCIVDHDLSALHVKILKKGDKDIEGLTDVVLPKRKGPKRADKIRKLFNLTREDDVTKFVIRQRKVTKKGKVYMVAPKIQRLITPSVLATRKRDANRVLVSQKRSKDARKEYEELVAKLNAEKRERKASGASDKSGGSRRGRKTSTRK